MIPTLFAIVLAFAMGPTLLSQWFLRPTFAVPPKEGIFVLSGASSGIGRATCGALAERHPSITLYCGVRRMSSAQDYPFTLSNVQAVLLDVTQQDHVDRVMDQVQASGLPLLGIINNAGVFNIGTVEFQSLDEFQWHYETNLFGTFRLTQAALPLLRQTLGSRVVLISSLSGAIGPPARMSAYAGTKHALGALGDALRLEAAPLGISISIVEPGFIRTNMVEAFDSECAQTAPQELAVKQQVYPHLYDQHRQALVRQVAQNSGFGTDDTVDAIDHALFTSRPFARYRTAGVAGLSASIVAPLVKLLPIEVADFVAGNMEMFYYLQPVTLGIANAVNRAKQYALQLRQSVTML